ncbi:MAG TPA: extracellular solute-binding protein, partial [Clostridia bacterium]|nr:extracellular solute-binding protein [Clostridia bacterium]
MKKTGFRLLSLMLALLMALSLTSALAEANGEIKILTNVTGGKDDAEMLLFAEALGKAVGAKVTMEKPAANYGDVVMQKLGAGEVYDLIYLNAPQMFYLQEQGALTDLTDYVKASPILSDTAVIPADEWEQVSVDGRIYAGFNKTEVHRLVNINKVVAEKAGIDVDAIEPTLDGYYEVM